MLIGVNKPTRLQSTWSGSFLFCFNLVLTRSMSLSGIMGGGIELRLGMVDTLLSATSSLGFP